MLIWLCVNQAKQQGGSGLAHHLVSPKAACPSISHCLATPEPLGPVIIIRGGGKTSKKLRKMDLQADHVLSVTASLAEIQKWSTKCFSGSGVERSSSIFSK